MEALGKFIGLLMGLSFLGLFSTIIFGTIHIKRTFFETPEVKSKVRITPEIELTTDGKKVDTVFIYKLNKQG